MSRDYEKYFAENIDERRLYAQEVLILEVTELIAKVMHDKQINRTQLAEMLGVGKSAITQMLSGSRNLRLRTLSDILFALGVELKVSVHAEQTANEEWTLEGPAPFRFGDFADMSCNLAPESARRFSA